jgi:UDP-glucose 4-epimerase
VARSAIEALAATPEIDEIVGLTRHRPSWEPAKTSWVDADIVSSALEPIFSGADVVIHLAWAIQPSRDLETLERINVEGSRRVIDAVEATGVTKLVYASSVGAYSRGPRDRLVSEDWPVGGIESSFYSRQKTIVEELLDELQGRSPQTKVIRLRPALIFKGDAAAEIRRLFAGPFLPSFLVDSSLIPVIPRIAGLSLQAVHSDDVGSAYALATVRDVEGPFNLAAQPALGDEELAHLLDARTFPLPTSLTRQLVDLSWRLRLQPTPPGWLDMALQVPLMSADRAVRELGWEPRHSASEAIEELLAGIHLAPAKPVRPTQATERLLALLTDAHAIEMQALAQLRAAPKVAGDERLAEIFAAHLSETEEQEQRVRERLGAYGGASMLDGAASKAGGIGVAVFADSQPETPGKLTAHAFSYEHLEIAAYEQLQETAVAVGDEATAAMAAEIAAEEQQMTDRLEAAFDLAIDASLKDDGAIAAQLDRFLADAHAIERQAMQLLDVAPALVANEQLKRLFAEHRAETEEHQQLIWERLEARQVMPSKGSDATLQLAGQQVGAFFAAQPDTSAKLTAFAFAFEHLEIATYELLRRVAEQAGDEKTRVAAERVLAAARAMAGNLAGYAWPARMPRRR